MILIVWGAPSCSPPVPLADSLIGVVRQGSDFARKSSRSSTIEWRHSALEVVLGSVPARFREVPDIDLRTNSHSLLAARTLDAGELRVVGYRQMQIIGCTVHAPESFDDRFTTRAGRDH